MQETDYATSRSVSARNGLLRNIILISATFAISVWGWWSNGGTLNAILSLALGLILLAVLLVWRQSKTPLEIKGDEVVISGIFVSRLSLRDLKGVGEHPTRKTPSLTYSPAEGGDSGELALPWTMIAEPQEEVVSKLLLAIEAERETSSG